MLTTLVASVLVARLYSSPPQNPSLHTVDLPDRTQTKVINGVEKEVNVHYSVKFSAGVKGSGDSRNSNFRAFRDLNVRPEKPAAPFRMRSLLDLVEVNDGECLDAFLRLREYGAPNTIGMDIQTGLQRCLSRFERSLEKSEFTINPMRGVGEGGWTHRVYAHLEQKASCHYDVIAEWREGGETKTQIYASGDIQLGTYWIPLEPPYLDDFSPDGTPDKKKQTAMGGITIEPKTIGMNVQIGLPEYNWTPTIKGGLVDGAYQSDPPKLGSRTTQGYINDVTKENGEKLIDTMSGMGYSIPEMIDALNQLAPEGTDMNRLNFPVPKNPCNSDFDAPPGTTWIPSDPSYQTMMTGVRYNLLSGGFDLYASTGGAVGQDPRAMRVLCMNMEKKEPAKGIKYFPYRPSDPVFTALAKNMDDSNFRGPWDQARLWIYSDKATIDQINKKLAGGLSSSAYLMALADVDWAGGLDERLLKDGNYVKPEFMMGTGAPDYAKNFLMNTLDELHPKKAGEWLKKNGSTLLQLVGPESEAPHHEHLAKTLKRLTLFNAPEDREAALKFIQAGQKELAGLKGQLGTGRVSLYSGRNEEVAVALALLKSGYLAAANDALAYVAENGPGDANKALAKELMGG